MPNVLVAGLGVPELFILLAAVVGFVVWVVLRLTRGSRGGSDKTND